MCIFTGIPVEEASKSKFVAIVITRFGGHIGFLEGILPVLREDYISRLFTQYLSGVFMYGSELLAEVSKDC
jgi:abhydrolase domain-containing protein 1/3